MDVAIGILSFVGLAFLLHVEASWSSLTAILIALPPGLGMGVAFKIVGMHDYRWKYDKWMVLRLANAFLMVLVSGAASAGMAHESASKDWLQEGIVTLALGFYLCGFTVSELLTKLEMRKQA